MRHCLCDEFVNATIILQTTDDHAGNTDNMSSPSRRTTSKLCKSVSMRVGNELTGSPAFDHQAHDFLSPDRIY